MTGEEMVPVVSAVVATLAASVMAWNERRKRLNGSPSSTPSSIVEQVQKLVDQSNGGCNPEVVASHEKRFEVIEDRLTTISGKQDALKQGQQEILDHLTSASKRPNNGG